MDEILHENEQVNNSFYDAVIQEIIEWEREKVLKEAEKTNEDD